MLLPLWQAAVQDHEACTQSGEDLLDHLVYADMHHGLNLAFHSSSYRFKLAFWRHDLANREGLNVRAQRNCPCNAP